MPTVTKKKSTGTNVRISDKGYSKIKSYCDKNGLKISLFCELSILKEISSKK